MTYNTDEINRLIKSRRSIYPAMYTGEKIDSKIIHEILENANWAPTHRFTEPWRFSVYSGKGIEQLADFQARLYESSSKRAGTYKEEKFATLKTKPLLCSHIISIGLKRDPKESVPEIEEVSAVAAAVQNMQLTATANKVGCYWGTGGITYLNEAKPFFELGEKDRLLGFLYLGISKTIIIEGKRRPVSSKIRWILD